MTYTLDLSTWQSAQILCLVSKPDSTVIEVEVDRNAVGQDILDKVCASIGTVEKDYFGLQFHSSKREPLWLNSRNRINTKTWQSPLRLRLRVKYFVEPHYLLQDSTRKLFYLQLKQDFVEGRLNVPGDLLATVLAVIAQAEYGDLGSGHLQSNNLLDTYSALCPVDHGGLSNQYLQRIVHEHAFLRGTTKSGAVGKFLSMVSTLPDYGMEPYHVKLDTSTIALVAGAVASNPQQRPVFASVEFRIGPRGIEIVDVESNDSKKIPFRAVQLATNTGKQIDVHVYQDDGSVKTLIFRAPNESQSNALYKIITEMLAFYTWDTVHSSVIHQHSLDFKGHFIALFRPNNIPEQGKQYIFDVQRTLLEAHDHARRTLYRNQNKHRQIRHSAVDDNAPPARKGWGDGEHGDDVTEVDELKERLRAISDALTCQVCCDREIDCAFAPCGHQICCKLCAERCPTCPLCRETIDHVLTVYLPISKDFVTNGDQSTASDDDTPTSTTPTTIAQSPTTFVMPVELAPAQVAQL